MAGKTAPTIGLALSGGAARGIAHIGVLEALEIEDIPVSAIAGTSAGSVIGALYAAGLPIAEIKRIVLHTKWNDIFRLSLPKLGLIPSEGIYEFMERVLPVRKFSSLRIPFAAVATDLRTGEKVSITTGSIARAVQASCSLPVIFAPTVIGNRLLVDGGVVSQIPVRTAREVLGADKVIAVDVNYKASLPQQLDGMVKIAMHLAILTAWRNAREEEKLADVVIGVNAKGIGLQELRKGRELLRRGRAAAEEKLPEIRKLLEK
jgi:NTE family protein